MLGALRLARPITREIRNFVQVHGNVVCNIDVLYLSCVKPSSFVYSHTCNIIAPTNIQTRVSPYVWPHFVTNATSNVRTCTCGLLFSAHAYPCYVPKEMHLSPSFTPSSASALLVHIFSTMCKMIRGFLIMGLLS